MPYLTETELSNYFQTIDQQAAENARLTAGSEAMQEDARNNTATINMLMAQLAEQVEENRDLRQMLHMEPR